MVQELTPLHHHVSDLIVRCNIVSGDQRGRYKACSGLRITVVPSSFLPTDRHRETVLVDGLQYSSESRVRRAPSRMAQIIATAVYSPIFVVEAPVGTILLTSMTGASGQSFDFFDLKRDMRKDITLELYLNRLILPVQASGFPRNEIHQSHLPYCQHPPYVGY